jgi:NADPH-dependent 2,4-dienoyl-CoA reductase/sulfur reductase-like enzyme
VHDVVVVGAGPAGLAAAEALRGLRVVVLDREPVAGGVPRHCAHGGFGWHDLRRMMSGPSYARRRVALAEQAGAELRVETTALALTPSGVRTTSPTGIVELAAPAVLVATGCRERPRSARMIPGDRPAGVLTTGALQQLVHLDHRKVGERAVVVGAEHVSFSAVQTLRESGTEVVAIVTPHPRHQSYAAYRWWAARLAPVLVDHDVVAIRGHARVEAVVVRGPAGEQVVACDTVVFTGDWIPDHELARLGGLAIDPATRGPAVDAALRTSRPGVFAAGNALRGAEPADIAAVEGRAAAGAIRAFLDDGRWPAPIVSIVAEPPLLWVAPSRLAADHALPPRERFGFRVATFLRDAHVVLSQGVRVVAEQRFPRLVPNRWYGISASFVRAIEPGEDLRATVVGD